MHSVCITWKTIHHHGDIWLQHLKLRKRLFVDGEGWQIPHDQDLEFDQYDTGFTRYVITLEAGKVCAASRMIPCSFDGPTSSYMIRDAMLGRLSALPTNLLADPPRGPDTFEATRFTCDTDLAKTDKNRALAENARALARFAAADGAARLIALMHPAFARWLTSIGLSTARIGPVLKDADGNKMCVLAMQLAAAANHKLTFKG